MTLPCFTYIRRKVSGSLQSVPLIKLKFDHEPAAFEKKLSIDVQQYPPKISWDIPFKYNPRSKIEGYSFQWNRNKMQK